MNAAQLKDQIALLENTLAAIDAARAALPDIYKSVSIQSLDASASEAQVKLYREKTKQAYASTSKLKELVAAANPTLDQAVNSFAKDQANVNIKKRASVLLLLYARFVLTTARTGQANRDSNTTTETNSSASLPYFFTSSSRHSELIQLLFRSITASRRGDKSLR